MSSASKAPGVKVLGNQELPLHDHARMNHPNRMLLATISDHSCKEQTFDPSTDNTDAPLYGSLLSITSRLSSAELAMLDGFQECGSFVAVESTIVMQARRTLEEKAKSINFPSLSALEAGRLIIECLPGGTIAQSPTPEAGATILVKIFAFNIFTLPEMPWQAPREGFTTVWKWTKPESPYLKEGFWQTNIADAILDGGLRAGTNLRLLARSVSIEKWRSLEGKRVSEFP